MLAHAHAIDYAIIMAREYKDSNFQELTSTTERRA